MAGNVGFSVKSPWAHDSHTLGGSFQQAGLHVVNAKVARGIARVQKKVWRGGLTTSRAVPVVWLQMG